MALAFAVMVRVGEGLIALTRLEMFIIPPEGLFPIGGAPQASLWYLLLRSDERHPEQRAFTHG
jgi:hypothetical protein